MRIQVYQIDPTLFKEHRTWEEMGDEFSMSDYHKIYEYDKDYDISTQHKLEGALEAQYSLFNSDVSEIPNYAGRCLCVSDVIAFDNNYYYCDGFGWKNITEYVIGGTK